MSETLGREESATRLCSFLYKSVPDAVKNDPKLHELLSLVDAIRVGRVREQNIASQELEQRLIKK